MRIPALRLALTVVLGAAVSTTAVASVTSARQAHPTNRDQSLKDGCQRPSFANLTLVNSPEWVYVNRSAAVRFASGVTRVPHPTPVDQPGTHEWFDFNANLVPDKAYRYLVAGTQAAHTNNFAGGHDDVDAAESFARLHYEWEEGSFPKYAWPADGDRTAIWGSWIWDCGHWTTENQITGERTEFHPLSAIAVTRRNPAHARAGESETDAYISSAGTSAHASEACAKTLPANADGTYGTSGQFFDCARDPKRFTQPLARSYTFTIPAPRRPSGHRTLRLRSTSRARTGKARVRVRRTKTGFRVTVTPRSKRLAWGRSYFARWSGTAPRVTRLRVTLRDLLVKRADPDPSEGGADPAGEKIALYLELNGDWRLVNAWAPSLFAAHDNMLIHLGRTISLTVPKGRGVELFMMGRECDGPSGVTLFGHFVPNTKPCPYNPTESKISEHNNDDPGSVLDRYASPGAALGEHVARSKPTVSFPGTGPITFNDGVQGNDDYELTYTVARG